MKPGLVISYDLWPGNVAEQALFHSSWDPRVAVLTMVVLLYSCGYVAHFSGY